MKLIKLTLKNIRSYETQEILFPEGIVLLSGNVGSGKTTILLAIEYALFGLQAGQKGAALLRNDSEEASVILECEIDGNYVIIERGLKKDKRSISSDYAILNINGSISECSATELKSRILQLIGYPSEFLKKNNLLYKYTVYTPQEQMKQIVIEDSESRLSIIRSVFGIDKYKTIRSNLEIVLSSVKDKIKSLQNETKILEQNTARIDEKKARVALLEEKRKEVETWILQKRELRKIIEKESSELEGRIKEKDNLEKEIEKTSILINSKKEILYSLEKEILELKRFSADEPKFNQEEYISTISKIADKQNLLDILNASYLTILSKIHSIEQTKSDLLGKKQRVFSMQFCPTCLQDVPEVHKHNILNETESKLSENKKQLELLESERINVSSQISREKAVLESLEKKKVQAEIIKSKALFIERSRNKIQELEKLEQGAKNDLSMLDKHVLSLKEEVSKFSMFDIQAKRKAEELKQAFMQEKNAEISRAEVNKEMELIHLEITTLSLSISEGEKTKSKLNKLIELQDWFSSYFINLVSFIEIQIMLKLRVEFSKLFAAWFSIVAGEYLETQLDESFTPIILNKAIEMDYSFLSGGERTAVALAYRLALNQTINSVLSSIKTKDLIILDEPTEGFSEAQIDKIRDILYDLKIGQIIIVSHEQKIESFADHVIKITKENGVSKVFQ